MAELCEEGVNGFVCEGLMAELCEEGVRRV
jgi:hypothetical protein